jgi:hypothetical protein
LTFFSDIFIVNQSNNQQKQTEEQKKKEEIKKKKQIKKKREIKHIRKILGLTSTELMNCKADRITKTCRQITKTIYPDHQSLANEYVSTMSLEKINAIHRKCSILETRTHI